MKAKLFLYVLTILIFAFYAPYIVYGGEQLIEKIYKVPKKNGLLRLNMPITWNDEISMSPENQGFIIRFAPPMPISSTLYIRITWDNNGEIDFNLPVKVKKRVKEEGKKLLPRALEKDLQLQNIKGKKTKTGYFFRLTDKAPNPGAYKYICQGSIGVGNLLLSFTFFTNEKNSEIEKTALAMLVSAEQLTDR